MPKHNRLARLELSRRRRRRAVAGYRYFRELLDANNQYTETTDADGVTYADAVGAGLRIWTDADIEALPAQAIVLQWDKHVI